MVTARRERVEPAAATCAGAATVADAMLTDTKLSHARTTVREVRELLANEHVHAAVIVEGGRLLAVVEHADLPGEVTAAVEGAAAAPFGSLAGRVVTPATDLEKARQLLLTSGGRRLAVVDADGTFLGLLCLKRSRAGFCSNADIAARRLDPRPSGRAT